MVEFFPPGETSISQIDAWKLLRIMAEFVNGFETFTGKGPFISIFGGTRFKRNHPYYKLACEITAAITKKGFSIITGAGPGIMEAANKTCQENNQASAGLIPDLPYELEPNEYLDPKLSPRFRYFFVRKVMFVRYAQGFVFLPGGYGTLDEFFEVVSLIQTKKIPPTPVFLVGSEYWKGFVQWLKTEPVKEHCIFKEECRLFTITDDPNKIANGLLESYHERVKIHDVEENI